MNYPIQTSIIGPDAAEFAALPDAVKWEVLDLLEILKAASASARPRGALMEAVALNAHKGRGWSLKSLERKYYALRDTRDWRVLVDRAKVTGGAKSEWVTDAVTEAWKGYCDKAMRSYKSAWLSMMADYRKGMPIGDVDWRKVWQGLPSLCHQPMPARCPAGMPLPPGWSYHNLMRRQPRLIERLVARQGRHAARKATSRVHTTRANMPIGSQYEFDDMWHNTKVMFPGFPKTVRPLELACIDIASAHKVAYGLKPRLEDADGKRKNLTEKDMRFMVAHILCNIGYHPDGCMLLVEGGTATIKKGLGKILSELSDGRITVSTSGVDRIIPLGKWGYDTRGNPDHKAHTESWHNLAQNRLDAMPGYTGSNSRLDKPEDHDALMRVVDKTLAAACTLTPELASRLKFPVLDWQTFEAVVKEVYAQIDWSNDHKLEGWEGRTTRQWKAHPADIWHSEAEFRSLPETAQAALKPLLAQEGYTRLAPMSRAEAWESGQAALIRLPEWAICSICGVDLAQARECPPAEIVFVDREVDEKPMIYRLSTCIGPDGADVVLEERKIYLWLVNPFDNSVCFVSDTYGRYVGKCLRVTAANRNDIESVHKEMGRAAKEFKDALQPFERRATKAAKAAIIDMDNNAALLRKANGQDAARIAEERSITADRRDAIRGISLADLASAAGTNDTNEDMEEENEGGDL